MQAVDMRTMILVSEDCGHYCQIWHDFGSLVDFGHQYQ